MQKTRLINTADFEKQCTEMEEVQLLKNCCRICCSEIYEIKMKNLKRFFASIVTIEESDLIPHI